MNGFLKNPKLLEEDCKVKDLLDFSAQIAKLRARIDAIARPAIVALTGAYGIGKSTMLHQMQEADKDDKNIKWILFDAWKYPNRKDLWEGFVLDFAAQINERKSVKKKMDGGSDAADVSGILEKIAGSFGAPLAPIIGLFKEVFKKSPATRVFEIQEILAGLINKQRAGKIIFVLEDTDRSGEAGMLFLETFNQFLKTLETDKSVVAIAPVSDAHYNDAQNKARYLKAVDYETKFDLKEVKLEKFVNAVFDSNLLDKDSGYARTQLISFLDALVAQIKPTIRELKFYLRECNSMYIVQMQDGLTPDFRITIAVKISEYFPELNLQRKFNRRSQPIVGGKGIVWDFICSTTAGDPTPSIYRDKHPDAVISKDALKNLILTAGNRCTVPTYARIFGEEQFGIADFYFS